MSSDAGTVLLWGDTQVGKTTLLTVALCHGNEALGVIDRAKSAMVLAKCMHEYNQLCLGKLTPPTSNVELDHQIVLKDGRTLRFKDVMGGLTRENPAQSMERLHDAKVVLFLVEWNADDVEHQMNAIRGAWDLTEGARRGLIFTKCEMELEMDSPAWQAKDGWWRAYDWLAPYQDIVARFGSAVWPTSNFGFDLDTGFPAVALGEFAQLIPYRINPFNVHPPFEWALRQL